MKASDVLAFVAFIFCSMSLLVFFGEIKGATVEHGIIVLELGIIFILVGGWRNEKECEKEKEMVR